MSCIGSSRIRPLTVQYSFLSPATIQLLHVDEQITWFLCSWPLRLECGVNFWSQLTSQVLQHNRETDDFQLHVHFIETALTLFRLYYRWPWRKYGSFPGLQFADTVWICGLILEPVTIPRKQDQNQIAGNWKSRNSLKMRLMQIATESWVFFPITSRWLSFHRN
mgnify:CR=1 FL=1